MNKVILIGNICNDVVLKQTSNETAVLSNTIAVRRNFRNQSKEFDSDFINFTAYRSSAELIANYFKKGDRIGLTGRWQTRSYTKDSGEKAYVNELIVEDIEFLQTKREETKEQIKEPADNDIDQDDLPF